MFCQKRSNKQLSVINFNAFSIVSIYSRISCQRPISKPGQLSFNTVYTACVDPEVVGVRTPLKNHKAVGFLNNTGTDPMNNQKATKPAFHDSPVLNNHKATMMTLF